MQDEPFELTELHVALLRELAITWQIAEVGAPTVEPAAPYGTDDLLADLRRIADEAGASLDDEALLHTHREMETVLDIAVSVGVAPGRYTFPDRAAFLATTGLTSFSTQDVGRTESEPDSEPDGCLGIFLMLLRARRKARRAVEAGVPDRTFEVTRDHLALLQALVLDWEENEHQRVVAGVKDSATRKLQEILDEEELYGVPAFDPKRPYGSTDLYGDIAEALGGSRELPDGVDEDEAEDEDWDDLRYPPEIQARFQQLHEDQQAVVQIVAVHAPIEPGSYRRVDRPDDEFGWMWRRDNQLEQPLDVGAGLAPARSRNEDQGTGVRGALDVGAGLAPARHTKTRRPWATASGGRASGKPATS